MIFSPQGNQREGKTLLATALAEYFQDLTAEYKIHEESGIITKTVIPIVANYHIQNVENFIHFDTPSQLIDLNTKAARYPNSILVYDELGASTDSRLWGSKQQIIFTHLFSQFGKQGITFIYTTQRQDLVDIRVRKQTDFVIECQKSYTTGRMFEIWYNTQRGIDRPKKIGKYEVIGARRYYRDYDTFEAVQTNAKFDDIVGK